jgi:cytochrome oxidase Cu insertion factor (SCO1/SenC/PrrC family)
MSDPTKFFTTCSKHCEARSYQITVRQQTAKILQLEAKVQSLMVDYCPEEMTRAQLDDWVESVKVVKPVGVSDD